MEGSKVLFRLISVNSPSYATGCYFIDFFIGSYTVAVIWLHVSDYSLATWQHQHHLVLWRLTERTTPNNNATFPSVTKYMCKVMNDIPVWSSSSGWRKFPVKTAGCKGQYGFFERWGIKVNWRSAQMAFPANQIQTERLDIISSTTSSSVPYPDAMDIPVVRYPSGRPRSNGKRSKEA